MESRLIKSSAERSQVLQTLDKHRGERRGDFIVAQRVRLRGVDYTVLDAQANGPSYTLVLVSPGWSILSDVNPETVSRV